LPVGKATVIVPDRAPKERLSSDPALWPLHSHAVLVGPEDVTAASTHKSTSKAASST
jgi:hypothetical protein